MTLHRAQRLLVCSGAITILWMMAACSTDLPHNQATASEESIVVNTDTQALGQWIDLARLPATENVRWVQQTQGTTNERLPGPTDYYVVAILEYEQDTQDVASQLGLTPRADVYVADSLLGDWMPEAVVNQFSRTPDGYLRFDGTAYEPGSLLLPPLNYGYVLFVDRYIVVYGATT